MKTSTFVLPALLAIGSLIITDAVLAQPDGGRMRGNWMGMGGTMGLLNSDQVHDELELMEDQIEELKAIQQTAQQAMRDMFSEMQDIPREERRDYFADVRERLQERMKEFETEADQVLLPHQKQRLKQLSYQSLGRRGGAGGTLSNKDLQEKLGISEDQARELEEARTKAQEELRKKYSDLVREAEDDILKVLTSEQRAKYKELVGEAFQFEDNQRGRFFGGRGGDDRGQRGRDRGGNRDGQGERSDF